MPKLRSLKYPVPRQYDPAQLSEILNDMLMQVEQIMFNANKGHKHTGVDGDAPTVSTYGGTSDVITEGSVHLFVTTAEKSAWNGAVSSSHSAITLSSLTGITLTGQALSLTAGYSIPTDIKQGQWDTAYTNTHVAVTIGTPANGLSMAAGQVLSLPVTAEPQFAGITIKRAVSSGQIQLYNVAETQHITIFQGATDPSFTSTSGKFDFDDDSIWTTGDLHSAKVYVTGQVLSTLATGTAPFSIDSTTKVSNLNVDLLDGLNSTAFAILAGQSGGQTLYGGTGAGENLVIGSTANATKGLITIGGTTYGIRVDEGAGTANTLFSDWTIGGALTVSGISTLGNASADSTIVRGNLTLTDSSDLNKGLYFSTHAYLYGDTTQKFVIRADHARISSGDLVIDASLNNTLATTIISGATSNWSMTLPVGAGTDGYVLKTNGSGVTSWVAQSFSGATSIGTNQGLQVSAGALNVIVTNGLALSAGGVGLAAIGNNLVLGNVSGGAAVPTALSKTNLKTMLGFYESGDNVSVGSVTSSSLTATRIPYASTDGLLVDSAKLKFDGTNITVGATGGGGFSYIYSNDATSGLKVLYNSTYYNLITEKGMHAFNNSLVLDAATAGNVISLCVASSEVMNITSTGFNNVRVKSGGVVKLISEDADKIWLMNLASRAKIAHGAGYGFNFYAGDTDAASSGVYNFYTVNAGSTPAVVFSISNLGVPSTAGVSGLAGTKVYYVSDSSGGTVNRKLTFTNGILTGET